jgi:acetyl esterase/lipase
MHNNPVFNHFWTYVLLAALQLVPTLANANSTLPLIDKAYVNGGGPSQRLDLYVPEQIAHTAPPLLVWIHGGGWREGDKRQHPLKPFLAQGYAVASINYRLSGEAPFPAQIDDVRTAIQWLRANASTYGFDPQRIGVIGHSAGGHLSALFGVTAYGENAVQAVCSLSGTIDMERLFEQAHDKKRQAALMALFAGSLQDKRAQVRAASPLQYITRNAPPLLLVHGALDTVVPVEHAQLFADALKAKADHPPKLVILEDTTHAIFLNPRWLIEAQVFFALHLQPSVVDPR